MILRIPLHCSFDVTILFVLFGQADRERGLESRAAPEEAFLLKFLRASSCKIRTGQTFFAGVTRKVPFISRFVFTLVSFSSLTSFLPLSLSLSVSETMPPWKICHGLQILSPPESRPARFHYSLLTYFYCEWSLGHWKLRETEFTKTSRLLCVTNWRFVKTFFQYNCVCVLRHIISIH